MRGPVEAPSQNSCAQQHGLRETLGKINAGTVQALRTPTLIRSGALSNNPGTSKVLSAWT